jgi:hypothetical protein
MALSLSQTSHLLDPKPAPDRDIANTVSRKITPAYVNMENTALNGKGMLADSARMVLQHYF